MGRCSFTMIALGFLCLLLPVHSPEDIATVSARKAAPDFSLVDSQDIRIKLSAYRGKVVLLDFWETFCGGCMIEIPWYMEFQNKYKDDGFAAIGVSMDDDGWKSVKPFLKKMPVNYPIVIGNQDLANRYGGITSFPLTLLIDRNGKIAESHAGMVDKSTFENEIKTLLQEKPTSNR